jgi:hypothetical protein
MSGSPYDPIIVDDSGDEMVWPALSTTKALDLVENYVGILGSSLGDVGDALRDFGEFKPNGVLRGATDTLGALLGTLESESMTSAHTNWVAVCDRYHFLESGVTRSKGFKDVPKDFYSAHFALKRAIHAYREGRVVNGLL